LAHPDVHEHPLLESGFVSQMPKMKAKTILEMKLKHVKAFMMKSR